jgi:phosphatidylglycerol---prolipoprotein diacylglyceryl transferase
MYPILFSISSLDIHANTIFFILGCLAGLWVGHREVIRQVTKKKVIYDPKGILKFFAIFLPFVYLFGMINAWLFHLDSIILHPSWQSLAFSGWISYGGIIGALLFGLLYPKIVKDIPVGTLDIVALILPVFEGVYRIGCLLNGCCYGRETIGFGGIYLPNSIGQWAVRYPTQILYIALGFGLFIVLWLTRKKKKFEGEIALRYLILYGAGRFLIDGLRADSIDLGWINLHQALDLGLMIAGLTIFGMIFARIKRKKNVR